MKKATFLSQYKLYAYSNIQIKSTSFKASSYNTIFSIFNRENALKKVSKLLKKLKADESLVKIAERKCNLNEFQIKNN